ncbi:hypothetical protein B0H17DRAFT_504275 [Mycena rosella]|uniref:Uncharacterized protein n=1 Tax=Mycena rosella TaxID=1033263 RepID=A0AAD7C0I3_MYCRO|nr:hypothetical protein B0H17DRAFT_504275 [Mycena rosella]
MSLYSFSPGWSPIIFLSSLAVLFLRPTLFLLVAHHAYPIRYARVPCARTPDACRPRGEGYSGSRLGCPFKPDDPRCCCS